MNSAVNQYCWIEDDTKLSKSLNLIQVQQLQGGVAGPLTGSLIENTHEVINEMDR